MVVKFPRVVIEADLGDMSATSQVMGAEARRGRVTHDLSYFPLAVRACKTMLVAVPLMCAGVAIDDLAIACCVEVAIGAAAVGIHASRSPTALVRGEDA